MSFTGFHALNGEAYLKGPEGSYLSVLMSTLSRGMLIGPPHLFVPLTPDLRGLPTSSNSSWTDEQAQTFESWWKTNHNAVLVMGTERVRLRSVQLNTVMQLGTPLRMAARIDGQCVLHCYVEGPNRSWMAEIIQEGLKRQLFRTGMGWEEILTLLLSRDDEPVVLSDSTTETGLFRGTRMGVSEDIWSDMKPNQQWQAIMAHLRERNLREKIELTPDGWEDYFFGPAPGYTVMSIAQRR